MTAKRFAYIYLFLMLGVIAFQVAAVAGAPVGEYTQAVLVGILVRQKSGSRS